MRKIFALCLILLLSVSLKAQWQVFSVWGDTTLHDIESVSVYQISDSNDVAIELEGIGKSIDSVEVYHSTDNAPLERGEGTFVGGDKVEDWKKDGYNTIIVHENAVSIADTFFYSIFTRHKSEDWAQKVRERDSVGVTEPAAGDTDPPDAGTADGELVWTNGIAVTYTAPTAEDANRLRTWITKIGSEDTTLAVDRPANAGTHTIQLGALGDHTLYWNAYDSLEIITKWYDFVGNESPVYKDTIVTGDYFLLMKVSKPDTTPIDVWRLRFCVSTDSGQTGTLDSSYHCLYSDSIAGSGSRDSIYYAYIYEFAEELYDETGDPTIWISIRYQDYDLHWGNWSDGVMYDFGATGNVYYVDATNGNDSNTGTSTDQAWQTIAKVSGESFSPGDNILFKRGEVWREFFDVPSGGASGNHVIFSDYGSGNKPIISAANLVPGGSLVQVSGNKYYLLGISTEPKSVAFNDTLGIPVTSSADVNALYEWYWTTEGDDSLFFYVGADTQNIEYGQRDFACRIDSLDYITLSNLQFEFGNANASVFFPECSDLKFDTLTVQFAYNHGLWNQNADNRNIDSIYVRGGLYSQNGLCGVQIGDRVTFVRIQGVEFSYNSQYNQSDWSGGLRFINAPGADAETTSDIIVENCESHHNGFHLNGARVSTQGNGGDGFWFDTIDAPAIMRYNKAYNNAVKGFVVEQSDSTEFYYNISYDNQTGYIFQTGNTTYKCIANEFYNNISYSDTISFRGEGVFGATEETAIDNLVKNNIFMNWHDHAMRIINGAENDSLSHGHGSGNIYDYNQMYPAGAATVEWRIAQNYTYADWTDTFLNSDGVELSSVSGDTTDPVFTDAAGFDFTLQSGSPCIDAGYLWAGHPGRDFDGDQAPANGVLDIGAQEYGGSEVKSVVVAVKDTIAYTGWWTSEGDDRYAMVDEETADGDVTYIATSYSNSCYFVFEDFNFSFSSITSLEVRIWAKEVSGSVAIQARLHKDGTAYTGSDLSLSSDYEMVTQTWYNNPETGSSWASLAELNSFAKGFLPRGISNEEIRVTKIELKANYVQ